MYVINKLERSGAETMLFNLSRKLGTMGIDQEVLVLRPGGALEGKFTKFGILETNLELSNLQSSVKSIRKLRKKIKDGRPDIVVGWMYHSCIAAALVCPRKTPLIWSIHHSLDQLGREKILTQAIIRSGVIFRNRVSKYIFVSKNSAQQHTKIGYPADKTIVIPNGFDLKDFHPNNTARKSTRALLNLGGEQVVVGSAARFHPLKNHSGLIRAFSQLLKDYPDTILLLAGRNVDIYNNRLAKQIRHLKVENNVKLVGDFADMQGFMNAIDFYVSASISESFPLTLGEAMATGTPCVSTNIGACELLIGETGKLTKVEDDEQLVDALNLMVSKDRDHLQNIGKQARKRIEESFELGAIASLYCEVFEKLIQLGVSQNATLNRTIF